MRFCSARCAPCCIGACLRIPAYSKNLAVFDFGRISMVYSFILNTLALSDCPPCVRLSVVKMLSNHYFILLNFFCPS